MTEQPPFQILIKPSRSLFGGRRQWKFELRAANGERIDPRDTFANRDEASAPLVDLACGSDPVELVIYDRDGNIESTTPLR